MRVCRCMQGNGQTGEVSPIGKRPSAAIVLHPGRDLLRQWGRLCRKKEEYNESIPLEELILNPN